MTTFEITFHTENWKPISFTGRVQSALTEKATLCRKDSDASIITLAGLVVLHNNDEILSYSPLTPPHLIVPHRRRPNHGSHIFTSR